MDENYRTTGKCPCGIQSFYVNRTQYFHGHGDIVVGGQWWHTTESICPATPAPE